MKSLRVISVLTVLAVAIIWLLAKPFDEGPPAAGSAPASGRPPVRAAAGGAPRLPHPATGDPQQQEQVAEIIQQAVVTYSPAGVALIRPYLLDPDPVIRQAARDGLVQLGEADAIPFLRAAAGKLEAPEEVASLHEAADLLALPAWSDSEEAREAASEIRKAEAP